MKASTQSRSDNSAFGLPLADSTPDLARGLQGAVREAHTNAAAAKNAAGLLKERLARRKQLEREIGDSSLLCSRYKTLGQELHRDNFIAFVLAESMERLAALASVELLRISGDRYSLVAESDGFDVIDHQNADERRSVATLSGGETFLASLALALALAGSVRDLGGSTAAARLDAIVHRRRLRCPRSRDAGRRPRRARTTTRRGANGRSDQSR